MDNAVKEILLKPRPLVKWAGGKRQLLGQLEPFFPQHFSVYHEPFVGGGAVFFHLLPPKAVLIDSNPELINFYLVVRDRLDELLSDVRKHRKEAGYYYRLRDVDPETLSPVERASRFLYLNRTAYNGLWRVNRQGRYNVPFGRYRNPRIADEGNLRLVSAALKSAEIIVGDFSQVLEHARAGDFVYLDPPYNPVSRTASFTAYTAGAFGPEEQRRLGEVLRALDRRGCFVMLSNSDTEFIRQLYEDYDMWAVRAKRAINCKADGRGSVTELVIRKYSFGKSLRESYNLFRG